MEKAEQIINIKIENIEQNHICFLESLENKPKFIMKELSCLSKNKIKIKEILDSSLGTGHKVWDCVF